jgi:hypothetical protein
MGSAPSPAYSTDSYKLPDQFQQPLNQVLQNGVQQNQQFGQQVQQGLQGFNTNFSQFNPTLNTNFAAPQFSTGLDATSNNLLSQQGEAAAGKLAGTNQQIASTYGNKSPGLAQILQTQAGVNSQLSQNGNVFNAQQNQMGREAAGYQLGQQAQSLGNQAQLAQSQANQNGLALNNQAIGQRLQIAGLPAEANQNLAALLSGLGILQGQKVSTPTALNSNQAVQQAFKS